MTQIGSSKIRFFWIGSLVLVLGLVVIVWRIPRASVLNTIHPSMVSKPVYRGESGSTDQFYVEYHFDNSGITEVDITGLDSMVLLNGSDYHSQQVSHMLATVEPGSEAEIIRVIQQSNAPISFTEGQTWNITLVTEISAESSILFFQYKDSITEVNSYNWEVNLIE